MMLPLTATVREALLRAPKYPADFPFGQAVSAEVWRALRHSPHLTAILDGLREQAAHALSEPVPVSSYARFRDYEINGERQPFQMSYFARRTQTMALALLTLIEEKDDYLPALHEHLWAICNEYTWCVPAHLPPSLAAIRQSAVPPESEIDLFAAETAHLLAEVLLLLGERLDEWVRYRIRREVERRLFTPLLTSPRLFPRWEGRRSNWGAVCSCGIGISALILIEDRERLALVFNRLLNALALFRASYSDDGCCIEGIKYWIYGFGHYTYLAEALRSYTDGAVDLLADDKTARMAAFPAALALGANDYFAYGDATLPAYLPTGLLTRLHARLGTPVPPLDRVSLTVTQHPHWANLVRDLLWTSAAIFDQPLAAQTTVFRTPGVVMARRVTDDGTVYAFGSKGGHNGESHNHNDLGVFILHAAGDTLLVDLGAGEYTRQYFGEDRYGALGVGSLNHSLPLIDGTTQGKGSAHYALLLHADTHSDGIRCTYDLTAAYPLAHLTTFTRQFQWHVDHAQGCAVLTLRDEFSSSSALQTLEEIFISTFEPVVVAHEICWTGQRTQLRLRYEADLWHPCVEQVTWQSRSPAHTSFYRLRLRATQPAVAMHFSGQFILSLVA
jgi:hypothetical protein